jgi:DNA-binding NarL/FixJ family response regulator
VPIKVVLAEDSYLVREGVRRLLEYEPDIELVAVCEDYDSLLEAIAGTEPDVLLTDIRMPPTGTDEGVRAAELAGDPRAYGVSWDVQVATSSTPTGPTGPLGSWRPTPPSSPTAGP